MCTDIDTYADKPPRYLQYTSTMKENDTCIVRLYGANDKGNSIAVHVYNFRPYFYIQVPVTMNLQDQHMVELQTLLNSKLAVPGVIYVTECELLDRRSIMHYSERPSKFVKVYT